jgi:Lrp/AsnC family transcriptional regulator
MNALEERILKHYQAYPDLALSELAEKVSMSNSAFWKRLKKLESDGFIEGRENILNQEALGLKVTVIAEVKLAKNTTQALNEFEAAVKKHEKILSCYVMSGDSDYLLKIVDKDIRDYERFLRESLANLPYVSSLKSSFALKCVKNSTHLPI